VNAVMCSYLLPLSSKKWDSLIRVGKLIGMQDLLLMMQIIVESES
jgi:hypothetical protein